jgi:hypothetical protein
MAHCADKTGGFHLTDAQTSAAMGRIALGWAAPKIENRKRNEELFYLPAARTRLFRSRRLSANASSDQ